MASGQQDPITYPAQWDVVRLGGIQSPGVAQVGEFKRKHTIDKKVGKGTVGGTTTFVGKPPVQGSIKFLLWDNGTLGTGHNHFLEWETFRTLFKYDPTKKTLQAVDIFHPALADLDINSVLCESIGTLVYDGQGLYSCTVELCEYAPPPKQSAVSTPTGSVSNASSAATAGATGQPGTQPDPAVVALQKEADALAKQAAVP